MGCYQLTFGEYLTNPYGRGVGVAPTSMIRDSVTRALANEYPSPMTHEVYQMKDRQLIFHCHLPSRTKENVRYDVIIQLDLSNVDDHTRIGINSCPFQCFSNAPSFYYTYAKVFEERGLFCSWLKKKYERKIMRRAPVTRNPSQIVGYERTVYTCMYVLLSQYRTKAAIDILNKAPLATIKQLTALVKSQEEIELEYDRAPLIKRLQKEKEEKALKKKEHAETMSRMRRDPASSPRTKAVAKSAKSKRVQSTKRVSKSSKSKKI